MKNVLIERLSDEMHKKGWSGRALSEAADLSYNAVYYILNGKRKTTKFEVIEAIAQVLEVSPFYLLGQDETKPSILPKIQSNDNNTTISYDRTIYSQVLLYIEEYLQERQCLSTERVEFFAKRIYPAVYRLGEYNEQTKGYVKGMIDYALGSNKD